MRWDRLFDDLEAQWSEEERLAQEAELADTERVVFGEVTLSARLHGAVGQVVRLHTDGAGSLAGRLQRVGPDWVLLVEGEGREALVATAQILTVERPPGAPAVAPPGGQVAARLDLRFALRGLARDRAPVRLVLRDGSAVTGTIDRVGADFAEVAVHEPGEARRAGALQGKRDVAIAALVVVRVS